MVVAIISLMASVYWSVRGPTDEWRAYYPDIAAEYDGTGPRNPQP